MLILVASATATTGAATVRALSAAGATVRALVRKADDPRASPLGALPGVTLFEGDLDSPASLAAALSGVTRALLVTSAFSVDQYDRETDFVEAAAAAGLEATVRISTGTFLISAGTASAYGRAHYAIEAAAAEKGRKVINLHPNWFLSNWLGNAGEAKATGAISLPVAGTGACARRAIFLLLLGPAIHFFFLTPPPPFLHQAGPGSSFIDPEDVGSAAAAILTLPSAGLAEFLALRDVEVHGPQKVSFADVARELSAAVGYSIALKQVPSGAWTDTLISYGVPKVFARSFCNTVEKADAGFAAESSPLLLKIWQPKSTVAAWASSVKGVFAK